jgi:hypothetical protein
LKDWRYLTGKKVLIQASGITYRGTMVEMGVSSVILKGPEGFQEIPWTRITRMEEDRGSGPGPAGPSGLAGD